MQHFCMASDHLLDAPGKPCMLQITGFIASA